MNIAFLDNLAYNRDSLMHRASAISKIVFATLVISALIISNDPLTLFIIFLFLVIFILISDLPLFKILAFCAYAFFFSAIFAISGVVVQVSPFAVMLKAVTAATVLVFLLATTPYPDIFAFLQSFLPTVLVDVMFLTYRSFFILLEQIGHVYTAIKIRGGYSPRRFFRNLKPLASILGHAFIHAFRLNQRLEGVMFIRGYSGKVPSSPNWRKISVYDLLPISLGALALLGAIVL